MKELSSLTLLIVLAGLSACGGSSSSGDALAEEAVSETVPDGDASDPGDTSTADVLCNYEDVTLNAQPSLNYTSESTWICTDTTRELTANGIPDHEVGTFPNPANPNTISEQTISASYTLNPVSTGSATETGGPRGDTGYVLNGVRIDAGTGGSERL